MEKKIPIMFSLRELDELTGALDLASAESIQTGSDILRFVKRVLNDGHDAEVVGLSPIAASHDPATNAILRELSPESRRIALQQMGGGNNTLIDDARRKAAARR